MMVSGHVLTEAWVIWILGTELNILEANGGRRGGSGSDGVNCLGDRRGRGCGRGHCEGEGVLTG